MASHNGASRRDLSGTSVFDSLSPGALRQRPCRGKLKPARPLWSGHRTSFCPFRRLLWFISRPQPASPRIARVRRDELAESQTFVQLAHQGQATACLRQAGLPAAGRSEVTRDPRKPTFKEA